MRKDRGVFSYLVEHFFRRFFDNDTSAGRGRHTDVGGSGDLDCCCAGNDVRVLAAESVPAAEVWGSIEDQYFFVMFSMVVMGMVAIFEWEMLFPDRWIF